MIGDTVQYEKAGTPIIGIENLQIIGRITRSIKSRIGSAVSSFSFPSSLGLAVGSHAPFSAPGSAYLAQ
jgi:hypothetical protein